jgi:nucleotide-binding universal stress UspA family protein
MAHLDVGRPNDGVLAVTADLARRFEANVIGIAACQPLQIVYGAGYMTADVIDIDRREIVEEMAVLETRFRAAVKDTPDPQWRAARTPHSLAAYIARQARAADLIITAPDHTPGMVDNSRRVGVGELAMRSGRPLLIVPDGVEALDLASVVIAWKDTREARRAVADALPLLDLAGRVSVVELAPHDQISEARQSVGDVVTWLGRHGIRAEALATPLDGVDGMRLDDIARERRAGLMVAGAYGHTRLREWVFGGVTCDFLMHPGRCTLVSH